MELIFPSAYTITGSSEDLYMCYPYPAYRKYRHKILYLSCNPIEMYHWKSVYLNIAKYELIKTPEINFYWLYLISMIWTSPTIFEVYKEQKTNYCCSIMYCFFKCKFFVIFQNCMLFGYKKLWRTIDAQWNEDSQWIRWYIYRIWLLLCQKITSIIKIYFTWNALNSIFPCSLWIKQHFVTWSFSLCNLISIWFWSNFAVNIQWHRNKAPY